MTAAAFEREYRAIRKQVQTAIDVRFGGKSREWREDVAAKTMTRLWRVWERVDEDGWVAYTFRVAERIGLDTMRADLMGMGRIPLVEPDVTLPDLLLSRADRSPSPLDLVLEAERWDELEVGVASLKPCYRTSLLMAADGLSYAEIAEATGVGTGTVRSRIHRGRKLLESFVTKR